MAVLSDGPGLGQTRRGQMAAPPDMEPAVAFGLTRRLGAMSHYIGAIVSVALVAGVAVWGYKLIMRDVNGIPVVRAMEGPMRIAPENPGGEVALHTGLAVNAIAAVGEAAPPEDMLTLAPATPGLAAEDLETALADGASTAAQADMADIRLHDAAQTADTPQRQMTTEDVLALVDSVAAGVDPLSALAPGADAPVVLSVEGEEVSDSAQFTRISADVPGVSVSLRPPMRPASAVDAALAAALTGAVPVAATAAPAAAAPTLTENLPSGTVLVQLGAYPSADVAATEWVRMQTRFAALLGSKERVIQEALSGGRTFFRLRATGFSDIADARRLCAALLAEGADCVPHEVE